MPKIPRHSPRQHPGSAHKGAGKIRRLNINGFHPGTSRKSLFLTINCESWATEENAHLIVQEKGGDSLSNVKDNQPTLAARVEDALAGTPFL